MSMDDELAGRYSPVRPRSRASYLGSPTNKRVINDDDMPSPVQVLHQKEMLRIQEMLQSTQLELERTNKEVGEMERYRKDALNRREQQYSEDVERLNDLVADLRDQIAAMRVELESARRAKSTAEEKTSQLAERLKQTEEQLETRIMMCRSKSQQVADLTLKLHDSTVERDQIQNQSQTEFKEQAEKMSHNEHLISLHESRLASQSDSLRQLKDKHAATKHNILQLEQKNADLERIISDLKSDLSQTRDNLKYHQNSYNKDLLVSKKLDQLKSDNTRLIHLLSKTREYQNFVEYVDEHMGIAYVPPIGFADQEDQLSSPIHTYSFEGDREPVPRDEWKHWIPEDALDFANEFKRTHLPHVEVGIFSELLERLNQIWQRRENTKLANLKSKYTEEIRTLRRQLNNRAPYDDVVNTHKIDHLKKELRKAQSSPTKRGDGVAPAMLDSTLYTVEHLAKQLSEIKSENNRLSTLVDKADRSKDSLFMEGAAWLGRKVVDISDRLGKKLKQLINEYHAKTHNVGYSPSIIQGEDWEIWEAYPTSPSRSHDRSLSMSQSESKLLRLQDVFLRLLEKNVLNFREKLRRLFEKVLETCELSSHSSINLSFSAHEDF